MTEHLNFLIIAKVMLNKKVKILNYFIKTTKKKEKIDILKFISS